MPVSGKSFAAKREIIDVFLATTDRIIIVDPMGEYAPLVKRLGGEVIEILENSEFLVLLSQAAGDREILARQLGISPHQLSYVTHSNSGEGLLFFGATTIPFTDRFPKDTEIYRLLTTRPNEKF